MLLRVQEAVAVQLDLVVVGCLLPLTLGLLLLELLLELVLVRMGRMGLAYGQPRERGSVLCGQCFRLLPLGHLAR